ncbi:bacterial bifunctional deaminase-reductase [Pleurotus eryngii]|uniref:2,5-diamino-6-ribosylamino-4(3H)-pyrimidinone 5'-phosphate reductase n=1 Tax=Pleurotus eryngii TaxID=5323 RepID=A0A9P6AAP5_PLEER|nr:bacterial bifunctional deaminase-reductase [Pleurotus eryngii]
MSNILTSTSPPEFLVKFYSALPPSDARHPRVTLTFAQSLDSKIAGQGGQQLILSGKESMIMTHWMRTMHDAIMVGIGTALNDNPQLNRKSRHLPPLEPASNGHGNPYHLPRPIILDTNLRLKLDCKLVQNFNNGCGRRPWVFCAAPSFPDDAVFARKMKLLTDVGIRVIQVPTEAGQIDIRAVLKTLSELGVRSLMVEGGASVIKSFFRGVSNPSGNFVDAVIVTVAPVFVGQQGIRYDLNLQSSSELQHVHSEILGKDAVLMLKSHGS